MLYPDDILGRWYHTYSRLALTEVPVKHLAVFDFRADNAFSKYIFSRGNIETFHGSYQFDGRILIMIDEATQTSRVRDHQPFVWHVEGKSKQFLLARTFYYQGRQHEYVNLTRGQLGRFSLAKVITSFPMYSFAPLELFWEWGPSTAQRLFLGSASLVETARKTLHIVLYRHALNLSDSIWQEIVERKVIPAFSSPVTDEDTVPFSERDYTISYTV